MIGLEDPQQPSIKVFGGMINIISEEVDLRSLQHTVISIQCHGQKGSDSESDLYSVTRVGKCS